MVDLWIMKIVIKNNVGYVVEKHWIVGGVSYRDKRLIKIYLLIAMLSVYSVINGNLSLF